VLVFIALLTAVVMLHGAVRSEARPERKTPAQQEEQYHHHTTSPFERVPAW
jgi:hypothetical protein